MGSIALPSPLAEYRRPTEESMHLAMELPVEPVASR